MKLTASCTPFEALPPKVWENIRRAVEYACFEWGVSVEVAEDLTVLEAQARFRMWQKVAEQLADAETLASAPTGFAKCTCKDTPQGYCAFCQARQKANEQAGG